MHLLYARLGPRVLGHASTARIAARFGLDGDRVREDLLDFVPLNRRLSKACTAWQMRPTSTDPMAVNDHTDWRWDERVLRSLDSLETSFGEVCSRLTALLPRFDGYAERYSAALARVSAGQRR